ncbi:MAG TPA: GGDEF domain-containing protein [Microvirga sp.]|nr:GGDEF domain-containing protein [Microvirga sp.]
MAGRRASFLGWKAPAGVAAPVDPAAALTRIGSTHRTWHLATDTITWGPNAAEVLGLAGMDLPERGQAFASLVEPGSGPTPREAILSATGTDQGEGVAHRARYALRIKSDRLLMVEELGRWHGDVRGRPAVVRAVLRVTAPCGGQDLPTAALRARTALLAKIFDDALAAQRRRSAFTLVVGTLDAGLADADEETRMAGIMRRVRPLMRGQDRFIPYGPDRFALALSSCSAAEAAHAVRRLHALVADPGVRLGAATAPDHALDAPELLRRAEEAVAAADTGYAVYRPGSVRVPDGHGGTSAAEILAALNGRRLVAGWRPVHDAPTRRRVFSTLAPRFLGTASGAVGDLEPAARAAGLSTLVDVRLIELAAAHLAERPDERVVVGVSPASLHDREWLDGLAAHLGARPGIQSRLLVSVHEAALREPAARGRLDAIKALGAGIVLSGFGTGHAGVRELGSLPVDLLRLDGPLVETIQRSPDDRLLVRGLLDLAQHLGIPTLAEGVEDEDGARLLTGWGVDYLERPLVGEAAAGLEPRPRLRRSATG